MVRRYQQHTSLEEIGKSENWLGEDYFGRPQSVVTDMQENTVFTVKLTGTLIENLARTDEEHENLRDTLAQGLTLQRRLFS